MSEPNNKKIVIKLNASALKESSCGLRTFLSVMQGYTAGVNSNDIEYGSAFHLFACEMARSGGNYAPSIKVARDYFRDTPMIVKPTKKWLTEQHLISTCMNFWETNGGGKDGWDTLVVNGQPLVEQKFAIPYYVDDDVEVLLCGTMDRIARRQGGGCYAIPDYKTTSVYDVEEYLRGYILSPQLIFYVFVLGKYAELFPNSIFATEICSKGIDKVGAFIDGIFLSSGGKDGVAKPLATFAKSDVMFFSKKQLAEFQLLLDAKVQELVGMAKALKADPNFLPPRYGMLNGACSTVYGACKYSLVCGSLDEVMRGHILRNNFVQKEYNPLAFH